MPLSVWHSSFLVYLVSIVPYDTHFVPRDDSDLKLDLRCDCVVSRSHSMPLSLVGDDVSNKLVWLYRLCLNGIGIAMLGVSMKSILVPPSIGTIGPICFICSRSFSCFFIICWALTGNTSDDAAPMSTTSRCSIASYPKRLFEGNALLRRLVRIGVLPE